MSKLQTVWLGLLVLALAPWVSGSSRPPTTSRPYVEPPRQKTDDSAAVIASLIEALADGDAVVAQNVSNALACLGPKSVPGLTQALGSQEKNVRARAAEILGRLGSMGQAKDSLPALLKALKDKEVEVRRAASAAIAQTLGSGQYPVAVPVYPTQPCCTTAVPQPSYPPPTRYEVPQRFAR